MDGLKRIGFNPSMLNAKRETPNVETLSAFAEIENGGGHIFTGTTQDLFTELLE